MNATERKAAESLGWEWHEAANDMDDSYWFKDGKEMTVGQLSVCVRAAKWEMVEMMLARCPSITLYDDGEVFAWDEPYPSLIEAFVAVCGKENKNG